MRKSKTYLNLCVQGIGISALLLLPLLCVLSLSAIAGLDAKRGITYASSVDLGQFFSGFDSVINDEEHNWVSATYKGEQCIKSAICGVGSATTAITATAQTTEAGVLIFDWASSSEGKWDKATFYVNDELVATRIGEEDCEFQTFSYPTQSNTAYTFKWVYSKDGSMDKYDDSAYIKNAFLVQGEQSVSVQSSNPTLGTVTASSGGVQFSAGSFAIGTEVTLSATPKDDSIHFEHYADENGNILSTSPTYTFSVTKGKQITAVFLPYAQTPTLTLAYGGVSVEITQDMVIPHNYFTDAGRTYTIAVSGLESGASAFLVSGGNTTAFGDAGTLTLGTPQNMVNEYCVQVEKSGKANKYIRFYINVDNIAVEQMVGDFALQQNVEYPLSATLVDGRLAYHIPATGDKAVKNAYTATVSVDRATTVHFAWRSVYGNANYLKFYIDGVEKSSISTSLPDYAMWNSASKTDFVLSAGEHRLMWKVECSSNNSGGAFYLADLSLLQSLALSVTSANPALGTVNAEVNGTYAPADVVTLVATATANAKFLRWEDEYGHSVAFDAVYEREMVGNTHWVAVFGQYADLPNISIAYAGQAVAVTQNTTTIAHDYALDADRVYVITWQAVEGTNLTATLNGVELSGNSYTLQNLSNSSYLLQFVVTQNGRETRNVAVEVRMNDFTYASVLGSDVVADCVGGDYTFSAGLLNGECVLKSNNAGVHKSSADICLRFSGQCVLEFDYSVSSEKNYDKFRIMLDDEEIAVISGVDDVVYRFKRAFSGGEERVLRLTYSKDSSGNKGADYAVIKNFRLLKGSAVGAVVADSTQGQISGAKSSYTIGESVHFSAVPNAGYAFVCFDVGGKSIAESEIDFVVEGDFTLTAVFASVGLDATSGQCIDVCNLVSGLSARGLSRAIVVPNATSITTYRICSCGGYSVRANGTMLSSGSESENANGSESENGVYEFVLAGSNSAVFEFLSGDSVVLTLEYRNAGLYGTSITSGYGTEEQPYLISNQTQFAEITNALSACYKVVCDIDFSGNISAIGTESEAFTGVLDGGGFSLSGVCLGGINANAKNVGLLGYASGAMVKNINILSPIIQTTANVTLENAGVLIGYAKDCVLSGVTITDAKFVTTSSALNLSSAGGVVGFISGGSAENITLNGLSIKGNAVTKVGGFAGSASSCNLTKITAQNVEISGKTYLGGMVGIATGVQANEVEIAVNILVNANNSKLGAGGCIGNADTSTNVRNCVVRGQVVVNPNLIANEICVGGFAGNGGNWFNSVTYAYVEGLRMVGGFVGGYQSNANFTDCHMAGEVKFASGHSQNYLYAGIVNGYGAWSSYGLVDSGQRISVAYTSSKAVSEIKVFNASLSPYGISVEVPTTANALGKYAFVVDANFKDTYASMGLLSETSPNGVVSNYGGMMIRFKMADGTYKYISTLDRANSIFRSSFDVDLDDYTAYADNFATMRATEENPNFAIQVYDGNRVAVWLTVYVDNANDFEHLSYIVNGGIPTTIGGYYLNMRSSATICIVLSADIDLTAERAVIIAGKQVYLNRVGGEKDGKLLNQFYGFGNAEMMPFRGSLDGKNHALTVQMDMADAYCVGVINVSNEQSGEVCIKDITIKGSIIGREQVGVLGFFEGYGSSGTLRLSRVKNYANISGYKYVGGIVGNLHSVSVVIENCENYGKIQGTNYRGRSPVYIAGVIGSNNPTNSGFVSEITLSGTSVNYGEVACSSSSVGSFLAGLNENTITSSSGAVFGTGYTLNVGKSGLAVVVNGSSYTSDVNGDIRIVFAGVNAYADLPEIVCTEPRTGASISVAKNAGMRTNVRLISDIVLDEAGNVYEYATSGGAWVLNAVVCYSDGTSEKIALKHNISAQQLSSGELVFVGAVLSNAEYGFSAVKTLKRMVAVYEDYANAFRTLATLAGADNEQYKQYGERAFGLYQQVLNAIGTLSEEGKQRAEMYLKYQINNSALQDVWSGAGEWFGRVVSSVDESGLAGLSAVYGSAGVQGAVVVTYVNGSTERVPLWFEVQKGAGLNAKAIASGFDRRVGGKVVFVYPQKVLDIVLSRAEITDIVLGGALDVVYDGSPKTASVVSFGVVGDDEVMLNLAYDGQSYAVNAGAYPITVQSLGGKDKDLYNVPSGVLGVLVVRKAERVAVGSVQCKCYSSKIVVKPISGAVYALGAGAFGAENEFAGLNADEEYIVRVRICEDENYLQYDYPQLVARTTFSATIFAQMISEFERVFGDVLSSGGSGEDVSSGAVGSNGGTVGGSGSGSGSGGSSGNGESGEASGAGNQGSSGVVSAFGKAFGAEMYGQLKNIYSAYLRLSEEDKQLAVAEKFSSIVTRFAEFLRVIDCIAVNALNIATSALSIGVWECVLSEDDVAESEADNAVNSNRASGGCVSCCKESSGKDSVMGGGNAPQSKGGDR